VGRRRSLCYAAAAHSEETIVNSDSNLIWIDMEMTGLIPEVHKVIEIAAIVTDKELNVLAEGPVVAIHQPDSELDAMDDWNTRQHNGSGLVDRVRASDHDEATATVVMREFLADWVPEGKSPMCGNSICQDRRFMARHMPDLERYFHYRNLDVSSVKILAQQWRPDLQGFTKAGAHLALQDIRDSIDELKYYREHFIRWQVPAAD
jgi:oligoribonuclease